MNQSKKDLINGKIYCVLTMHPRSKSVHCTSNPEGLALSSIPCSCDVVAYFVSRRFYLACDQYSMTVVITTTVHKYQ